MAFRRQQLGAVRRRADARAATAGRCASIPSTRARGAARNRVATSEVERLADEKREREVLAAQPVAPLPPELDWRRAGEFIEYSHTPTVPFWKHGYTSLFVYLGLLWLCSPVALIYVWLTEWRLFTKLYRTVICCVFILGSATYIRTRSGL